MLKKQEYIQTVYRPYPPFPASLLFKGSTNQLDNKLFVGQEFGLKNIIISEGTWFYTKTELDKVTELLFDFWIEPKNFYSVEKLLRQREEKLIIASTKNFDSFCQAYISYTPALIFVWRLEKLVGEKLKQLFLNKLSLSQTNDIMNQLNSPIEDNFYKLIEYDLATTKNLATHVKKFEWINSRYGQEKPYTLKEAQTNLVKIKKNYLTNQQQKKSALLESVNQAKKILGQENSHLIDVLQYVLYYRTQRSDVLAKAQYLAIPMLKVLAHSKEITYQELLHCTQFEIEAGLPSNSILQNRIKDHATILEDGIIRCDSGEESQKIKIFLTEKINQINHITGSIAFKGVASGQAKIVNDPKDYQSFKPGNILITKMITPNMISIMKLASAFVTDEGGITCHAAIISRELGIPCIIGTKHATKIFKDGDLVEVDATNGIVRKLSNRH